MAKRIVMFVASCSHREVVNINTAVRVVSRKLNTKGMIIKKIKQKKGLGGIKNQKQFTDQQSGEEKKKCINCGQELSNITIRYNSALWCYNCKCFG